METDEQFLARLGRSIQDRIGGRVVMAVADAERVIIIAARQLEGPPPPVPEVVEAKCPDGENCPDAHKYGAVHPNPSSDGSVGSVDAATREDAGVTPSGESLQRSTQSTASAGHHSPPPMGGARPTMRHPLGDHDPDIEDLVTAYFLVEKPKHFARGRAIGLLDALRDRGWLGAKNVEREEQKAAATGDAASAVVHDEALTATPREPIDALIARSSLGDPSEPTREELDIAMAELAKIPDEEETVEIDDFMSESVGLNELQSTRAWRAIRAEFHGNPVSRQGRQIMANVDAELREAREEGRQSAMAEMVTGLQKESVRALQSVLVSESRLEIARLESERRAVERKVREAYDLAREIKPLHADAFVTPGLHHKFDALVAGLKELRHRFGGSGEGIAEELRSAAQRPTFREASELMSLLASVHCAIGNRAPHSPKENARCTIKWIEAAKEEMSELTGRLKAWEPIVRQAIAYREVVAEGGRAIQTGTTEYTLLQFVDALKPEHRP